uniref:Uncharacterized protein n=1 Tax=Cucumis sativus TaxID=3659 RepID=A0A0A0K7I9_CUCSA
MLVANKESSQGIKLQLPTIEMRCQSPEETSRNSKNRDVLKIWIVVKAIAGDVMSIMSPFPPGYTNPRQTISRQNLSQFVKSTTRHYIRMSRIMTHISTLDPKHTQNHSTTQMNQNALRFQDPINHKKHHHSNRNQRIHSNMPLLLKQTLFGKFRRKLSVILRNLRDLKILEMKSSKQPIQIRPSGARMISNECIGHIMTR